MMFWLATPIYVTALSGLLLGEKIGWRRWCAVVVGFAGVIVALQPSGASLAWPTLLAVTGSVFYAFVLLGARYLRETSGVVLVTGPQLGSLVVGLTLMATVGGSVMPGLPELGLILIIAVMFTLGSMLSNWALKVAEASVVVPFQYTQIVWGVILGYVFFADIPAPTTIIGTIIIVAAGLYIFMREQKIGRAPVAVEST